MFYIERLWHQTSWAVLFPAHTPVSTLDHGMKEEPLTVQSMSGGDLSLEDNPEGGGESSPACISQRVSG